MKALFIGHNGMGDNLNMIGALRFMSPYYEKIYFVVKKHYYKIVQPFFSNTNIQCLPIECPSIIHEKYNLMQVYQLLIEIKNVDIFLCGMWKNLGQKRITNEKFIEACNQYRIHNETKIDIKIDHDMLLSRDYMFLYDFYADVGLPFNSYFEYFDFQEGKDSELLYNSVKKFDHIIFLQNKTSSNNQLNIDTLVKKYINDPSAILISNDENIYDTYEKQCTDVEDKNMKKELVKPFVLGNIVDFKDVILHSTEIYIIDSCLTSIILPFLKTNKLNAKIVRIINRNRLNEISSLI